MRSYFVDLLDSYYQMKFLDGRTRRKIKPKTRRKKHVGIVKLEIERLIFRSFYCSESFINYFCGPAHFHLRIHRLTTFKKTVKEDVTIKLWWTCFQLLQYCNENRPPYLGRVPGSSMKVKLLAITWSLVACTGHLPTIQTTYKHILRFSCIPVLKGTTDFLNLFCGTGRRRLPIISSAEVTEWFDSTMYVFFLTSPLLTALLVKYEDVVKWIMGKLTIPNLDDFIITLKDEALSLKESGIISSEMHSDFDTTLDLIREYEKN